MIMKFEETRNLGVLQERGWKPFGTENVEEVATSMVERASSSLYSLASGVSRELEIPGSRQKHVLNLLADFWREWKLRMRGLVKFYGQMRHSPRNSELQKHVIPALQERKCLQTTIFTQDRATPHVA
ncbi:hypothetical protein TNCV_3960851 [Trichonephila clavipes]|nr:hypothetical protein TNCV_3960851 [Trichonephila clavipes]